MNNYALINPTEHEYMPMKKRIPPKMDSEIMDSNQVNYDDEAIEMMKSESGRNMNSVPPTSILPHSPAIVDLKTHQYSNLIEMAQIAMFAYGYYNGSIDGILGPELRTSIVRFEKKYDLKITGKLSNALFEKLNISME